MFSVGRRVAKHVQPSSDTVALRLSQHKSAASLTIAIALSSLLMNWQFAFQNMELAYQSRGDRWEGLKAVPKSTRPLVELISAIAAYQEEGPPIPEVLRIKLYLNKQANIFLTVREMHGRYGYWMDRVDPLRTGKPGFDNIYAWPSQTVLRRLPGISMYGDLGVVARLGSPGPSLEEEIAPAVFYHLQMPGRINGYIFTFLFGAASAVTVRIYASDVASVETWQPVFTETYRPRSNLPLAVSWDCSAQQEGRYRMLLQGQAEETKERIDYEVYFYHKPELGDG